MSFSPEQLLSSPSAKRAFLFLLLALAITTAAGIHRSSIGEWRNFVGVKGDSSILLGKSRPIRSDEWLVATPWILSQANTTPSFPEENLTIGPGRAALLSGVPTWHFSSLFRPNQWGFFLFPASIALSWQYMSVTWGVLAGFFALGLLLFNGAAALSLTLALWVFFSQFTQWWFSTWYPLLLMSSALCATSLIVLLYSRQKKATFIAWCLFAWSSGMMLFSIYPPFLVVVGFFVTAAVLTAFLRYGLPQGTIKAALPRFGLAVGALTLIGLLVGVFFLDVADAAKALQATVYPGARVSLGGEFSWQRYLSGFFGAFMTQESFPRSYRNVCEASSFILLWPITFIVVLFSTSYSRFLPAVPLLLLCSILSIWELWGFSGIFAKITLMTMVPAVRAQAGLGPASILLSLLAISLDDKFNRPNRAITFVVCISIALAVGLFGIIIDEDMREELGLLGTLGGAFGISALCWAILRKNVSLLILSVLLLVVYPGFQVNPVARGLGPLKEVPLLNQVKRIHQEDPTAVWAAFGENVTPNLLATTGVAVFNGMKLNPSLEALKKFDPDGTHSDIYNRLAQMVLEPAPDEAIAQFRLVQADLWVLKASPCDPAFSKVGVRYFVFRAPFQFEKSQCLDLLTPQELPGGFWILKRK